LTFTIEEPEPIVINPTLSNFDGFNVSCPGACDGSVAVAPSGGVPDYTIAWTVNGADAGNGSSLGDLCGGDVIEVTITDAAGCEQSQSFVMSEPQTIVLDATVTNISCFGDSDGSIDVNVSGGAGGYTYTWTPDLGSDASLNNLDAGNYCLEVSDANGCTVESCWDITEPTVLTATITGTPANCGACDGVIALNITGGTAPYSVDWSGVTAVPDNTTLATELCVGLYTIVLTDAEGCSLNIDFDLPGPVAITIDPAVTQPLCYNDCDGGVSVNVQNGVAPYTYEWTNAQGSVVSTTNAINAICEGSFTLVVTDSDGCEQNATFAIAQPDSITINGESPLFDNGFNVSTFNGNNGSIATEVTGGTPDYFLVWEGPTAIDDDVTDPNGLVAGQYTLTVTDANGCSKDTIIVLTAPDDLTLPTGLSPNDDGANDTYVILGISEYPNNMFKVFNRWGNLVYEKKNYANEWAGTNNANEALPDGTYFIIFEASGRQFATYVDLRR
jgi:gliding motility-associated-like protein